MNSFLVQAAEETSAKLRKTKAFSVILFRNFFMFLLLQEFGFGVFAIVTLNPGLLGPALAHSHVDLLPEIYFWETDPNALFDSVPVNYRSVIL